MPPRRALLPAPCCAACGPLPTFPLICHVVNAQGLLYETADSFRPGLTRVFRKRIYRTYDCLGETNRNDRVAACGGASALFSYTFIDWHLKSRIHKRQAERKR